mmetsp:Transcript_48879/g.52782  ORF Transcript_48879/g.52782 Transcript_48879/m.52782 type:complete len:85 (+) Transcript_48879:16-270(+)
MARNSQLLKYEKRENLTTSTIAALKWMTVKYFIFNAYLDYHLIILLKGIVKTLWNRKLLQRFCPILSNSVGQIEGECDYQSTVL